MYCVNSSNRPITVSYFTLSANLVCDDDDDDKVENVLDVFLG